MKVILGSLQQQVGLELKYDAAELQKAGRSLDMLVSVTVKNASLDETLKAVLDPAGLKFRRMNKVVEIEAAEK